MTVLTRDQILSAEDIKSERVKVPEWGGEVIVRTMTGDERDRFEMSAINSAGERVEVSRDGIRALIVALSCVDEDGQRLFTVEDARALGEKSARALDRVVDAATRLSRLSSEDVEEMGKGLEAVPSAASAST